MRDIIRVFKGDVEKIQEILKVTEQIFQVYTELSDYRLANDKRTELFSALIKLKKVEKGLYDDLELNPTKARALMVYVSGSRMTSFTQGNMIDFSIYYNDKGNLISQRVLYNLDRFGRENDNLNLLYHNADSIVCSNEALTNYVEYLNLNNQLKSDIERAFLYYLDEMICDSELDNDELELTTFLNKVKYSLLFVSTEQEDELLEHEFHTSDNLVFGFPVIADAYAFDEPSFVATVEEVGFEACYTSLQNLIEESLKYSGNYDDDDPYYAVNIAYFKSSLALLSVVEQQELNDNVMEYIDSLDIEHDETIGLFDKIREVLDSGVSERKVYCITKIENISNQDN